MPARVVASCVHRRSVILGGGVSKLGLCLAQDHHSPVTLSKSMDRATILIPNSHNKPMSDSGQACSYVLTLVNGGDARRYG